MRVLFISAEVSPFAKVGGLADVLGGLPKALKARGHDVRIAMPDYPMIEQGGHGPITDVLEAFPVSISPDWSLEAKVRQVQLGDVPVYLVSGGDLFAHVDRSEAIYTPGIDQYLFFSSAALQMLEPLEWKPDVISCHDWQTGFIPVLMREKFGAEFDDIAATFTIHNLAYQGEFDLNVLERLGLPTSLFNPHQVEAWGRVNFLKSGSTYANQVNTVSPTYAKEVTTPSYGVQLDGLMRHLSDLGRFRGILNGLDAEAFDPMTDPMLAAHYSAEDLSGKAQCRAALHEELGFPQMEGAPLLGVVSRMSSQKGMDLIAETAEVLFKLPIQLVVLGAGEPAIVHAMTELCAKYPGHMRFIDGFNLGLGARIYSACDGFLMPSSFEPCGLGQLIARRFGAIPIVRATGGLADTVIEGVDGFVFHQRSHDDFVAAVKRFNKAFHRPKSWNQMVRYAMTLDSSWRNSAKEYEAYFEDALTGQRASRRAMA